MAVARRSTPRWRLLLLGLFECCHVMAPSSSATAWLFVNAPARRRRRRPASPFRIITAAPPFPITRHAIADKVAEFPAANEPKSPRKRGRKRRRQARTILYRLGHTLMHPRSTLRKRRQRRQQRRQQTAAAAAADTAATLSEQQYLSLFSVNSTVASDDTERTNCSTKLPTDLPAWAQTNAAEMQQLFDMKRILGADLINARTKMINATTTAVEAYPDVYADLRLLRFLRKDELQNAVSAADRYRDFLTWRRDHAIDERIRAIVDDDASSLYTLPNDRYDLAAQFPAMYDVRKHQKSHHPDDDDNTTRPLYMLLHVGEWQTERVTSQIRSGELPMAAFTDYWAFVFESMHVQLYERSLRDNALAYVDELVDLHGLRVSQLATPGFRGKILQPWIYLMQHYYPETTCRLTLLRPPPILRLVYGLVARLASPSTVRKVHMVPDYTGDVHAYCAHTTYDDDDPKKI